MTLAARISVAISFLGLLLFTGTAFAQETPLAGPCAPGVVYDSACDVDHDGDIDIFDIQLIAGRWSQTGVWTSDNEHNHLGQTWTGANNPLTIGGSFGATGWAPLVLSNSAPGGDGLRIQSSGGDGVSVTSATFAGFYVESTGGVGFQVNSAGTYGVATSNTEYDGVRVRLAGQHGVSAESTSATHYGGLFYNIANGGAGLYARGGNTLAPDVVLGGNSASEDDGRIMSHPSYAGSDIMLHSNDEVWLYLDDDADADAGNFVILNSANASVFTVAENGNMTATGTKSAVVETESHGPRLLYAMESPQNWFEDFGGGQLTAGQATIAFDPVFAETVNLEEPYRVFLTPMGDCQLYVAGKNATSFTVRAMGGQTCDIAFDYRVVALRRGYEQLRLETPEVIED